MALWTKSFPMDPDIKRPPPPHSKLKYTEILYIEGTVLGSIGIIVITRIVMILVNKIMLIRVIYGVISTYA